MNLDGVHVFIDLANNLTTYWKKNKPLRMCQRAPKGLQGNSQWKYMPLEAANGTRRIKFLEKTEEEISLTQTHEPKTFLLATWKAASKAGSLLFL